MSIYIHRFLLSTFFIQAYAYSNFQEQIPNAGNVPHPCKVNYRWPGLGHEAPLGGGARNVFGIAFKTAGLSWTKELCRQDSDGDGKTNGEELGDPDCVWSIGQIPSRTDDITHPGVCDPYDSPTCAPKNTFVNCEVDTFDDCDAINKPEVKTLDFRFSLTQIPATETNYYCMTFNLPNETDYHLVASEPLIDNANVLHHMLLYGCEDDSNIRIDPPQACGMDTSGCEEIISAWTVGLPGQCFGSHIGYRLGLTGYQRVRLEIHYNNPKLVADYTDTSGMRVFYQPARPEVQDMVTIMTGQTRITIPPGERRVEVTGTCPSSCTNSIMTKPAYIVMAINHMHYSGRSMKVEIFRNGTKTTDVTNDEFYNYDSPVTHEHKPPIEVRPGDELKTTCVYSSLSTSRYVFYGESTADEMCFGFLMAYPKDAFKVSDCVSTGPFSKCDLFTGGPVKGCDWKIYINFTHPETAKIDELLKKNCNLDGLCRPECREYLKTLQGHPCYYGEAASYIKLHYQSDEEGLAFLGRLHSCPEGSQSQQCPQKSSSDVPADSSGAWAVLMLWAILLTRLLE